MVACRRARRYNITTGRDNNGDAIFNDRPVGVGRNTLRGLLTTQTDFRLSWSIPQFRPNGTAVFAQRGPGGGAGPAAARWPGQSRSRAARFEMYLFVQNAVQPRELQLVCRCAHVAIFRPPDVRTSSTTDRAGLAVLFLGA